MDFADNKLTSLTKKIIDLIDQPNMQPNELKAYFDSSPEEVRQAHKSLCDALTTATSAATAAANLGFQTTAGVPADNVQDAIEDVQAQLTDAVLGNIPSGSVTQDKLAQDVRDRFTAIETAAATEVTNRTNAVNAEATARAGADTNLQTQINAKCEVIVGSYTGDNAKNRVVSLGQTPKAVLIMTNEGMMWSPNYGGTFGGLATESCPVTMASSAESAIAIVSNGFQVTYSGSSNQLQTNRSGFQYAYIAFL